MSSTTIPLYALFVKYMGFRLFTYTLIILYVTFKEKTKTR